jgi:hypothetical protein
MSFRNCQAARQFFIQALFNSIFKHLYRDFLRLETKHYEINELYLRKPTLIHTFFHVYQTHLMATVTF